MGAVNLAHHEKLTIAVGIKAIIIIIVCFQCTGIRGLFKTNRINKNYFSNTDDSS